MEGEIEIERGEESHQREGGEREEERERGVGGRDRGVFTREFTRVHARCSLSPVSVFIANCNTSRKHRVGKMNPVQAIQ